MNNMYAVGFGMNQSPNEYSYDINGANMSNRTMGTFKNMREASKQSMRNPNIILEEENEVNYSSSNKSTERSLDESQENRQK